MGFLDGIDDAVESVIDEVADLGTEAFPPKPGGLVDQARKRVKAAEEAAKAIADEAADKVEAPARKAVKVAQESPEVISAHTLTIAAGGTAQVLPYSPYRYRATVMAVSSSTAATTITLSRDQGSALGGVGFMLGAGTPFPVCSRAQLWAVNPSTAASIQVSVLAEIYAPER